MHLKNNVYGRKANEDFLKFKGLIETNVPDQEIQIFIDNSLNLRVLLYRTYEDEILIPM
jgi:hypothetical protein